MEKYTYLNKYKIKVITSKKGIAYYGSPQYPNGYLLAIVAGHLPMKLSYFRRLTFEEEIKVIKNFLKFGKEHERYPLVDECGQIAIYKDKSYVYDTIMNGSVLNCFDSFNNEYDEKEEEPIMIINSEDMLGILEDYNKFQNTQAPTSL